MRTLTATFKTIKIDVKDIDYIGLKEVNYIQHEYTSDKEYRRTVYYMDNGKINRAVFVKCYPKPYSELYSLNTEI